MGADISGPRPMVRPGKGPTLGRGHHSRYRRLPAAVKPRATSCSRQGRSSGPSHAFSGSRSRSAGPPSLPSAQGPSCGAPRHAPVSPGGLRARRGRHCGVWSPAWRPARRRRRVPLAGLPRSRRPRGHPPDALPDWNPVSAVTAACRELWGNPNPSSASAAWSMQHPVWTALAWSIAILVVCLPLASLLYRRRSTD